MGNAHGDFVWYELMTPDADAARAFYEAVVGWSIEAAPSGPIDYRMITAIDGNVAGLLPLTPQMRAQGARPAWLAYVAVEDVDAACSKAEAGGGHVVMPATDMDGVGRIAMLTDPAGAAFYVMRGASDASSNAFAKYAPRDGHAAWNELATAEPGNAWTFYGELFGWVKDGEMDMGPLGAYEFIKSDVGIGAIMPKMPEMPVSAWTTYFRVPEIDVAATAIGAAGGRILQDPVEIPGGDYSLVAIDPHGATFGLVGGRGA